MAEKRYYNNFTFTGEVVVPRETNKLYEVRTWDSGWQTHKLNVSIKESQTNSMFLELSAMYSPKEDNKVFALTKEGSKLEIPFADRNKASIIERVSDFNKFVVDLETDQERKSERIKLEFRIRALERKDGLTDDDKAKLAEYKEKYISLANNKYEFLTEYDFIKFIKESIGTLQNHKVRATGNISIEESKGKYYTKYAPKKVEIVSSEEVSELLAKYDIFFNKDAVDSSALKDSKKIFVEGYVMSYDRRAKEDRYFPKQFVINASAIDFNNEQHVGYLNMLKGQFDIKSKKTYYHLLWSTRLYKGAEVVEFDESMLTQKQKELIAFGLKTMDDFKPRGNVFGNKIEEIRLYSPELVGTFMEGAVDTGLKEDDFVELLAMTSEDVQANDVKKDTKKEEPKNDTSNVTSQLDALFK